ncbi:hypothetical protein [Tranquillimonas alkanivorans]|uniref:Flagellar motor switch protein n=1 Tax=Tranquillimonas alkanivorans TaxID=441119 RepID=A0A1I5S3S2_9RHOB|nr:hypothetical protein [Tranquillimonas alkanivorans]SFP65327.1 hypothetical protein SAMN04488047_11025 [Tranquillimonas alkanivorans]
MAILIDALILVLLAGTLGYAFLVDRRVRALVAALRDLQPMVGEFSAAVDKSESSVKQLRTAAERLSEEQAAPAVETRREPELSAPKSEQAPFFLSTRGERRTSPGVTRVTGKTDLVRSFFEQTRSRGA